MEYNCCVVLVSAVQWSESAICIHISLPSWTSPAPPLVITEHRAEFPVLHSSFPLAVCFTHGTAYVSVPVSQFVHPPVLLLKPHAPPPVHISILHVCVSVSAGNRFIITIFLDSTYMCIWICVCVCVCVCVCIWILKTISQVLFSPGFAFYIFYNLFIWSVLCLQEKL